MRATSSVAASPPSRPLPRRRPLRRPSACATPPPRRTAAPATRSRVSRALGAAHASIRTQGAQAAPPRHGDHVRVQHVAQVGRAQQLAQQRGVERRQRRALLGVRQVARVEALARTRTSGAANGCDGTGVCASTSARSRLHLLLGSCAPHVVHVLQALARRFHQDETRALAPGGLQQLAGRGAAAGGSALAARWATSAETRAAHSAEPARREQRRGAHRSRTMRSARRGRTPGRSMPKSGSRSWGCQGRCRRRPPCLPHRSRRSP